MVSPGLAGVPGLSVFVAVMTGATGGSSSGETGVRAIGSPAVVAAEASARVLGLSEAAPSDEFGDTESADAISIIKQLRQRMNATE